MTCVHYALQCSLTQKLTVAVCCKNIAGEVSRRGLKRGIDGASRAATIQQPVGAGSRPSLIHDQQSFIPIRNVGDLGELAGDRGVGCEYRDGCLRYRGTTDGRSSTLASDEYVTRERGILFRPNQWVIR